MEGDMLSPRFLCYRVLLLALSVVSGVLSPKYAQAVVDAHSQTNTVPPGDGSPWDHVGSHNGSSGVYLGERWALSAHHVGPGDITLLGVVYKYDGISFRL